MHHDPAKEGIETFVEHILGRVRPPLACITTPLKRGLKLGLEDRPHLGAPDMHHDPAKEGIETAWLVCETPCCPNSHASRPR